MVDWTKSRGVGSGKPIGRKGTLIFLGVLVLALVVGAGFLRLYYGGGMGMKLVAEHSFSYKDTIVNLDNILGKPRIVVASEHPAVKRQLEEMGVIETDEQIERGVEREIQAETDRLMKEIMGE